MSSVFRRSIIAPGATLVVAAVLGSLPASASATTTPQSCSTANTSTASGQCADTKLSSSSSSSTVSAVSAVGTAGKILTVYNMPNGIPLTAAQKANKGCPLVSKFSQVPRGATCFRGKRGFKFTNSGKLQSGATQKWADSVGSPTSSTPKAGNMKFVRHGSQWYKAGANNGGGNCGNKVWFTGAQPRTTWKSIINVKSWANWTFTGTASASAKATSTSTAKAWCNASGSSASSQATATGSASASGSASYKAMGLSQVKAWLNNKAASLKLQYTLQVNASASAKATAAAVTSAQAKATCVSTPPASQPPTIVDYTKINDVDAGATSPNVCVTFTLPSGDKGRVYFVAGTGSFSPASIEVSASDRACSTYTAPSDSGSTQDTIQFKIVDTTSGLSAATSVQTFPVYPAPVHPSSSASQLTQAAM